MISAPTMLLVCGIWSGCGSMNLPDYTPSLEIYLDVVWPPRTTIEQQRKPPPKLAPSKSVPKRKIINVPGYVPPLPVPPNWKLDGKGGYEIK